jgi:hypothetical protein
MNKNGSEGDVGYCAGSTFLTTLNVGVDFLDNSSSAGALFFHTFSTITLDWPISVLPIALHVQCSSRRGWVVRSRRTWYNVTCSDVNNEVAVVVIDMMILCTEYTFRTNWWNRMVLTFEPRRTHVRLPKMDLGSSKLKTRFVWTALRVRKIELKIDYLD